MRADHATKELAAVAFARLGTARGEAHALLASVAVLHRPATLKRLSFDFRKLPDTGDLSDLPVDPDLGSAKARPRHLFCRQHAFFDQPTDLAIGDAKFGSGF